MKKTICHRDGTVSYWSVYEQMYIRRAARVPDREYAAMGTAERNRVMQHMEINEDHNDYN